LPTAILHTRYSSQTCYDALPDTYSSLLGQASAEKLQQLVKARTWELEEALKAKTSFLNTVSHEIRYVDDPASGVAFVLIPGSFSTPLCGILGSLSLLEGTPLQSEQAQILRIANLCGEQLLVLVNDVLDRAKLEEGKLLLEHLPFTLHDTLAESLEMMATVAAKNGIGIASRLLLR
jgi:signal transduction histidine kinase